MKGREVMAAALVDVDEVRVEAIVGEAEGVKVRPEVSCFSSLIDSNDVHNSHHFMNNLNVSYVQ